MDGNNTNVMAPAGTMTLTDNATGKSIELPVIDGSVGPKVIDVRKLYAQTGYFTYDPGFMATAACRSSITYIDGDEGVLRSEERRVGKEWSAGWRHVEEE